MKQQILDAWVAALESGKYKQVEGHLKKGNSYCCLGVLCVVAKKEGEVVGKWSGNFGESLVFVTAETDYKLRKFMFDTVSDGLPDSVLLSKLGFTEEEEKLSVSWTELSEETQTALKLFHDSEGIPTQWRDNYPVGFTTMNDGWGYDFKLIAKIAKDKYAANAS